MTYQLRPTDKIGVHCEDNPDLMNLALSLFELYDEMCSKGVAGLIRYDEFSAAANRLYPHLLERDLEYGKFQVLVNREFWEF